MCKAVAMGTTANKVLALAAAEVGYLEKKSNAQLDHKTANAGSNNYTKYARDLDATAGFYNGKKQGFAWCDVFVDWLFVKSFGAETAKKMLFQPDKSYGAGCGYSAKYYKAKGRFFTKDPRPGDQIFFWDSAKTRVAHTGLVYQVTDKKVYTVEGNTSGASGVVANGGGVCKKSYKLTYGRIYGYGRPAYEEEKGVWELHMEVLKKGSKGPAVKALQLLLAGYGFSCGKWGADGDFGKATQEALKDYQKENGLEADGIAGEKTWGRLLGVDA